MIALKTLFSRSVLSAAIGGGVLLASTSGFALPRYDGLWSVSIITESGTCDRGYRYPIRISNGMLANAGTSAFTISGKVTPAGAITVMVSAGASSASGSGRLAGNIGAGKWRGGDCAGSWTAERRAEQAE